MPLTQLDYLRTKSSVDCDTLDASVAAELGPFVDCTSNQAIAAAELLHTKHATLIASSASLAASLAPQYPDTTPASLTVELLMISLSLLIAPHISGRLHTQTNPHHSFSTPKTIANAHRIVALYAHLDPRITRERVCVKIPATWEGLQACRVLEAEGIATLATTLFTLEQAVLAAEVGCSYIAPYVNRLAVHFTPGLVDEMPGFGVCVAAQRYFRKWGYRTQCLPASLVSTAEVLRLAGADHITVAPPLLRGLAAAVWEEGSGVVSDFEAAEAEGLEIEKIVLDEEGFRMGVNRSRGGVDAGKLVEVGSPLKDWPGLLDMRKLI
ncbi:hypothetical protein H2199_003427 [Coniosporium tulheliwenetii]|uniref:Uncharacterized protein n=1 Tax=Coniosporium tulheliwenetii TaxID=3383036 RepID=A0ACC2ZAF9_9PEZI|nr:hypothetical protein H2199_003427 [Cladosporium sp. JES 115]